MRYRRFVRLVSKYALKFIVEKLDRIEHVRLNSGSCGYILRQTYNLLCVCELA